MYSGISDWLLVARIHLEIWPVSMSCGNLGERVWSRTLIAFVHKLIPIVNLVEVNASLWWSWPSDHEMASRSDMVVNIYEL